MPPKPKLHKTTGKAPIKPAQEPETSVISEELTQQFEAELCWCIQQLQIALKSGKLNQKQIQEHTKAMNTLMNNSAPLVKKRQVMRMSFGDYRAKMAVEDRKLCRNASTSMKIKPATPSNKSVFLRRAFGGATENNFRFNFAEPAEDLSEELSNVRLESENKEKNPSADSFRFVPSDNSFRFNFAVEEDRS